MLRFIAIFTVALLGLFTLEMMEPVRAAIIIPFTESLARVSAAIIAPFDSDILFSGIVLRDARSGFAVSIESGCNGVEATIVLIAAVLAFPAPWLSRLAVMVLGFFTVQLMNIARIISLYYLGQWSLDVFTFIHLYLWPGLIMLDVLLVFMVYLRYLSDRAAPVKVPA